MLHVTHVFTAYGEGWTGEVRELVAELTSFAVEVCVDRRQRRHYE